MALSAVAKLQAALRIRAEVMGGLPDFSFILYGKVMYSKSFVLGKKKAKGQTAPSKKKSKGGAKGGKFVYDFHLLFPTMELGPFLKDSILKCAQNTDCSQTFNPPGFGRAQLGLRR